MKGLILIVSCLLLMLIAPTIYLGWTGSAVQSIACCRVESVSAATGSVSDDSSMCSDSDILYDTNAVTLLSTFDSENDDVIPFRMNSWRYQIRTFSSRLQIRYQAVLLLVKKLIHWQSVYLTTLINHISQYYSSIYLFCWQYAADCYVFALRQIII